MSKAVSDKIFYKNIKIRITDIAVQIDHASKKGISNQAKSGYYRFAILLACTIAEGLLYRIIRNELDKTGDHISTITIYKYPHNIPSRYSSKSTVLCLQEKKDISLSNQTKFSEMIDYAAKNNLVSLREKNKLIKIMRLRNKIHLQSLDIADRGYTKKKLDEIFSTINYLIRK
ncbi:hypothetical protein ACFL1U_02105 [Patescibacteria group bacterium]